MRTTIKIALLFTALVIAGFYFLNYDLVKSKWIMIVILSVLGYTLGRTHAELINSGKEFRTEEQGSGKTGPAFQLNR